MGDYGWNNAISKDANSLSYYADIPNSNYCVINIESATNYKDSPNNLSLEGNPKINDATINWLEDSLMDAEKRGKSPILLSYFPLTTDSIDIYGAASYTICYALDKGDKVLELLAKHNVHTVITAQGKIEYCHEHNLAGQTITELSCSSVTGFPSMMKFCKVYNDGVGYVSKRNATISDKYLPAYTTDEQRELAKDTWTMLSKFQQVGHFATYHKNLFNNKEQIPQALYNMNRLGLYATENSTRETNKMCEDLAADIANWMYSLDEMPFYGEGDTVEAICKEYGIEVPESRFNNAWNLVFLTALDAQRGYIDEAEEEVKAQLLYAVFCVGIIKICELDIFKRFNQINSSVITCDALEVAQTAARTGVINLAQNDVIISIASLLLPMLSGSALLNPLKNVLVGVSSEVLLQRIQVLMPALSLLSPEIKYFAGDNNNLETSFMSFSKGELYIMPFVKDVFFDVIYRTSILC